uniref:hypothetical protein n=1 Tax=Ekhidna sp. TaxID=2608089 RepID=UPI0032EFB408
MNRLYIFMVSVLIHNGILAQHSSSAVLTTHYYEFHSNIWVNLHHFAYEKARGIQRAKMKSDGFELARMEEDSLLEGLTQEERGKYDRLISYYKSQFNDLDMRSDMSDLTVHLSNQGYHQLEPDSILNVNLASVLNDFLPIYLHKIWPLHDGANRELVMKYSKSIENAERMIIAAMERVSGDTWSSEKVRIDITAYASWAGAYSIISPRMNLFISTVDPVNNSTTFIETVFHESSHLLFSRNSPFRSEIYFTSQEMGIEFPNGLWHASLFYLCGIATRDYLRSEGIDHKLYMDIKGVFESTNTENFRTTLDKYYAGNIDRKEAIKLLLSDY